MERSWLVLVLVAAGCGGGVTEAPDNDAISQFWTDDYKVFDQIYGKTSDKEIYGATLPPSISYGVEETNLRNLDYALDKKERYLDNDGQNSNVDNEQLEVYGFGARYPYTNLLGKEAIKALITKTTKSPLKFVSGDFKPISHTSDPDTYSYLKHLDKLQKQNAKDFAEPTYGGFKPYVSYTSSDPEDTAAYKSIQDILEAHEANKGKKGSDEDVQEYLTYPPKRSQNKKPKSSASGTKNKARCPSGRCRKRATTSYRVYTRPYVRRIKHKIIYSR